MRHKVELIITVKAVNTVVLCSRQMQIGRHDELQRALGSVAVEIWFDVATTAEDHDTRKGKRQSKFWCCWRKSLTIFNQLQRTKQARHNTMMWTVTMNLLGHRRPAFVCRVHRSFSATFSQSFFEPLNLVGSPTCHCSICPRPYLPNMCHARTEGALV